MGIKRIVDVSFWTDGKVEEFTPEDKYFMLYLLTNPNTTQLGIYEISIKRAAYELGYSTDAVRALIERFECTHGVIIYSKETNEIAVKNFLRHSIIKGGAPVRDCLIKELKAVKNKDLIVRVFSHIKGNENLNDTVRKIIEEYEEKNGVLSYCNEKENQNDNENDNEVSYPVSYNDSLNDSLKETYDSIISYLNEKAGTKYKASTAKTKTAIHARLSEGFKLDDFKTVIDKKCAEWIGTEYEKYLRPETLFGTKFEGYLNAKQTGRMNTNVPDSRPVQESKTYGNYI